MKERPILMNGEMVRAVLEGRKTQTRRVVKHIPMLGGPIGWCAAARAQEPGWVSIVGDYRRFCPIGKVGDRLWVRETFIDLIKTPILGAGVEKYKGLSVCYRADNHLDKTMEVSGKWTPSIHMPRWVSRINLEITDIRVERVQEISAKDAVAEGVDGDIPYPGGPSYYYRNFWNLWDSIYTKRGLGWDKNPFCWVVEFKRI